MSTYNFTKTPVCVDRLENEIKDSSITIALDTITYLGSELSITFKAFLSEAEEVTLASLVMLHTGEQIVYANEVVATIQSTPAFGNSAGHRFRGSKTDLVEIAGNSVAKAYYKVTENRCLNGGEIVIDSFTFGDYGRMWVEDKDGIYYPAGSVLDVFIEGWFLNPNLFSQIILPYPAGIIKDLYICIELHNAGTQTKYFGANLYLHKRPV